MVKGAGILSPPRRQRRRTLAAKVTGAKESPPPGPLRRSARLADLEEIIHLFDREAALLPENRCSSCEGPMLSAGAPYTTPPTICWGCHKQMCYVCLEMVQIRSTAHARCVRGWQPMMWRFNRPAKAKQVYLCEFCAHVQVRTFNKLNQGRWEARV